MAPGSLLLRSCYVADRAIPMMTLEKWALATYGENAPHIKTLRRWCCEGKIFPIPQKHGRSYFLQETARYVGDYNDPSFMGRIRDATQAQ